MLRSKKVANKLIPMSGNNVLLDTNIISAWLKGESEIADKLDRCCLWYSKSRFKKERQAYSGK